MSNQPLARRVLTLAVEGNLSTIGRSRDELLLQQIEQSVRAAHSLRGLVKFKSKPKYPANRPAEEQDQDQDQDEQEDQAIREQLERHEAVRILRRSARASPREWLLIEIASNARSIF